MNGTVKRWGIQGFGFIESPDLPVEAYFNQYFLRDPQYVPRIGDRVSFDAIRLPDGKYQARRVEELVDRPRPSKPPTTWSSDAIAQLERARPQPSEKRVAAAPKPVAPPRTLSERLDVARQAGVQELARLEGLVSKSQAEVAAAAARIAELKQQLRDAEYAAAEAERVLEERKQAQALCTRSDAEEAEIVAQWIQAQAERVGETLARRRTETRLLAETRASAAAKVGSVEVARFEEVRQRIRTAPDELTRQAFLALEAGQQSKMEEFARALNAVEKRQEEGISILGFVPNAESSDQGVIVVACLRPSDGAPDPEWRVLCAFWQAVERAFRELAPDAEIEHGAVAGCPAIRAGCALPDRELAEMALNLTLDDAWKARPSLGAWKLLPVFELTSAAPPPLVSDGHGPDAVRIEKPPAGKGGTLYELVSRFRLPLREIATTVGALGVEHEDDAVTPDVEITLRRILDLPIHPPARPTVGEAPEFVPPKGLRIVSRLLGKLFRDRRIGGRHTAIENAWGHHFASDEKDDARKQTERLIQLGWLREKHNNGQRHVSIDPAHIGEVRKVIDGTLDDPDFFED